MFFAIFSSLVGGDPTIEISGSARKSTKYYKLRGLSALGCTKYCKLRGLSTLGCTKYCKLRGLSSLGCTKYCKLRGLNSLGCTKYCKLRVSSSLGCTNYGGLEARRAPDDQVKKSFGIRETTRLKKIFFGRAKFALINLCEWGKFFNLG